MCRLIKILMVAIMVVMSGSVVFANSSESDFVSPVKDGKVFSEYNEKTGYKNVQIGNKNQLADETDIMASSDGVVVLLQKDYRENKAVYTIVLEHEDGYLTKYSGLSDVDVEFEEKVSQKDIIGTSDSNKVDFVIIKDGERLEDTGNIIGY